MWEHLKQMRAKLPGKCMLLPSNTKPTLGRNNSDFPAELVDHLSIIHICTDKITLKRDFSIVLGFAGSPLSRFLSLVMVLFALSLFLSVV